MANFVYTQESLGTAGGRDFALLASYLAGLPNPFGANESRRCRVFADGDFDERNLVVRPPNFDPDNPQMLIHAVPGQMPVWKPASGAGGNVFFTAARVTLVGLTADGTNLTGATALFTASDSRHLLIGCTARNSPNAGFSNASGGDVFWLYCLAEGCTNQGFGGLPGSSSWYLGCGSVRNGTGYAGRSGTNKIIVISSYALDNTVEDINAATVLLLKFAYISDTSWPAGDDIFRSQVGADLGFVDYAGGNFRLAAGSALIGKGHPLWNWELKGIGSKPSPFMEFAKWAVQDAFGQKIGLDFGTQINIGPFQPAVAAGGGLLVHPGMSGGMRG